MLHSADTVKKEGVKGQWDAFKPVLGTFISNGVVKFKDSKKPLLDLARLLQVSTAPATVASPTPVLVAAVQVESQNGDGSDKAVAPAQVANGDVQHKAGAKRPKKRAALEKERKEAKKRRMAAGAEGIADAAFTSVDVFDLTEKIGKKKKNKGGVSKTPGDDQEVVVVAPPETSTESAAASDPDSPTKKKKKKKKTEANKSDPSADSTTGACDVEPDAVAVSGKKRKEKPACQENHVDQSVEHTLPKKKSKKTSTIPAPEPVDAVSSTMHNDVKKKQKKKRLVSDESKETTASV